jgi:ribonucleoside-diphosphate reductase alpha chain
LGVNSKVTLAREEGFSELPKNDGTGDSKLYPVSTAYRLLISSSSLVQLIELGLKTNRLEIEHRVPQRNAEQFSRVVSVEDLGAFGDTYCVNEPKRHKAVFNGILTGNCNEISLPLRDDESFVCCLSSINLLHWDEIVKTDAIETLTYFLDTVMSDFIEKTEGIQFMERANKFARRHRALGVGALGWHSYLQSKMIPFDSMEAHLRNSVIFKTIQERTHQASRALANEFGSCEVAAKYGMRNTTTTAVAPTASSSVILGQVSQSIEPWTSNHHVEKKAKDVFVMKNHVLEKLLEGYGKNNDATWKAIENDDGSVQNLDFLSDLEKDVFKTFAEISQKAVIAQAGARQKFIDQGQSLNVCLDPLTPAKETNALVLDAWRWGVKGLYYQIGHNAALKFKQELSVCKSCEA